MLAWFFYLMDAIKSCCSVAFFIPGAIIKPLHRFREECAFCVSPVSRLTFQNIP